MVIDQHALARTDLVRTVASAGPVGQGRVAGAARARAGPPDPPTRPRRIERNECWHELGLEVEAFGGDTMLVRSPRPCSRNWLSTGCCANWSNTCSRRPNPPNRDVLAEILHMVACKAAMKAGGSAHREGWPPCSSGDASSPTPTTVRTAGRARWCSPRPSWRSSSGGSDGKPPGSRVRTISTHSWTGRPLESTGHENALAP